VSFVLSHDAIYLRQSQAAALVGWFGGVEWLKDVRQYLRRDTDTGVCHTQLDPIAGYQLRQRQRRPWLDSDAFQGDRENPALRHGVTGVDSQVHHHLLHAGGVGIDRVLTMPIVQPDRDVLRQRSFQQLDLFLEQWQQIERLALQHCPPAKVEDLLDQPGSVVGLLVDGRQPPPVAVR
jgi:hypothetical protein